MEINQAKPGSFCWFELATTDQAAAKKFYAGLFGWTANDVPMGSHGFYTMFHLRGQSVGAARGEPESADDPMGAAEPPVLVLEQHLVEVEARRIVDDERAGALPLLEAVRRDLVAVAPVLAVAGEDQAD